MVDQPFPKNSRKNLLLCECRWAVGGEIIKELTSCMSGGLPFLKHLINSIEIRYIFIFYTLRYVIYYY